MFDLRLIKKKANFTRISINSINDIENIFYSYRRRERGGRLVFEQRVFSLTENVCLDDNNNCLLMEIGEKEEF